MLTTRSMRKIKKSTTTTYILKTITRQFTGILDSDFNCRIPENGKIIDFRSDTFSLPSMEMRRVIYKAEVGDDVYGEDLSVKTLEKKAITMFEKEAACYFPTGTMSNLTAILVHCQKRGSEIIAGSRSHILLYEQTGAAQFGGINIRSIKNEDDGTFNIPELKLLIRPTDDIHEPVTSLICVENTHNILGGKAVPLAWLDEIADYSKSENVPLHLDGARIFNAAVKHKVPVNRLTRGFDTVSFCLNKALGAPIGAILLGSNDFIKTARRIKKAIGGGCRQIGFMAAAGTFALNNMVDRIQSDHNNCRRIADAIREANYPYITVDKPDDIHSNILIIRFDPTKVKPMDFVTKLRETNYNDESPVVVKIMAIGNDAARIVICCNNTDSDVDQAIKKIQTTIEDFRRNTVSSVEKISISN